MLAIKISSSILLFLFLLTLGSVKVVPTYKHEILTVNVYYLFFRVNIYPPKKAKLGKIKKPKKKRKKEKIGTKLDEKKISEPDSSTSSSASETKKVNTIKSNSKKSLTEKEDNVEEEKTSFEDLLNQLKMLLDLVKSSEQALLILKRHLIIDKVFVDVNVGGEDAHKTAISYANHITAFTGAVGVLSEFFRVKIKYLKFEPNFISEKSEYNLKLIVRIRLIWLLIVTVNIFIVILTKTNLLNKKGGKNHESTKAN